MLIYGLSCVNVTIYESGLRRICGGIVANPTAHHRNHVCSSVGKNME